MLWDKFTIAFYLSIRRDDLNIRLQGSDRKPLDFTVYHVFGFPFKIKGFTVFEFG